MLNREETSASELRMMSDHDEPCSKVDRLDASSSEVGRSDGPCSEMDRSDELCSEMGRSEPRAKGVHSDPCLTVGRSETCPEVGSSESCPKGSYSEPRAKDGRVSSCPKVSNSGPCTRGGRAAIVANGNVDQEFITNERLRSYDFIIGCDGGGMHLHRAGTTVDLLVGDYDSMDPAVLQYYRDAGTEVIEFPAEKDYTDLQLAVDLAIERGYLELDLFGVTGCRLDHTMANLMLLYHVAERGGRATIIDPNNIIFAADHEMEISAEWAASVFQSEHGSGKLSGKLFVSLVVIEDCDGITLEGFKYPLHDFHGKAGESRCISNELLGRIGKLRFQNGRMLVFISRD